MARLLSVNVGLPRDVAWKGRTVHTAVWKQAVAGKRRVARLNIDGDGQGDLVGHGGEQRAVLVYQIDAYRFWERELGRSDFTYGQFGENFTVDGLADDEVCIGDRWRVGSALFEVSQPRVTCYRVGIRMAEPRMAALLVAHHRPGFYFRVIEQGEVEAGDEIVKVAAGPERLTVADADALLYLPGHDRLRLERALRIPALSPGWKMSFRALADEQPRDAGSGNPGLAPDLGPPAAWPGFRSLRMTAMHDESRDVFSLTLEPADDEALPTALPGQFITLRLQAGPSPLVRSYSLSGPPARKCWRISIKQEPGGAAARYLREQVQVGDRLEVAAPRGAFVLRPGTRPVVLLSAGIGATPVLAMLHALAEERSPRVVWWIHGARDGTEHAFAAEVDAALKALPASRRCVAYSRPAAADRAAAAFDHEGRIGIDTLRRLGVARESDFYLCGPAGFMAESSAGLADWGVAGERIHGETFGPGRALAPGVVAPRGRAPHRPHAPPAPAGHGPLVSFARSGLSVAWSERDSSLLELAEACGVTVRWSCRTGVCHSCVTGLLDGAVDYRPEPLQSPGDGQVLICCARPRGAVTLDL